MTRLLRSALLSTVLLVAGGLTDLGLRGLAQPLDGLVGYWRMEEGSGTNTADLSGNNLTGTFDNVATWGGPQWADSPVGAHALSFDGANDRVVIGNPAELRLTGPMTVSAWVFPRGFSTSGRIAAKQGGGGSRGWSLNVENSSGPGKSGAFMVASGANALVSVVTTTSLASNQWVHLCGVYEPGVALRIYTNGLLNNENTVNVPAAQYNNTLNVTIGGRPSGGVDNPFNGLIDEVRVFNRALTEAEIQALPEVVQTPLKFTLEPVSRTVVEYKPVTFSAGVTGSPPYFIQWYENGSPLADANGLTYTIPSALPAMNGYRYSVVVSNLLYGVTSSNAVLTVSSDTKSPALVSVGSADGNTIGVCFDEPMDQNLFFDPAHFTVNGGAETILYSLPRADGYSAVLYLAAAMSGEFSVQVSGVTDLVGNPIAPGSTATGTVAGLTAADLGYPAQVGETYSCKLGEYEITAGGADIWGTFDEGHFASRPVSGDFDVCVQVAGLTPVHSIAKAGLMVRQTLDSDSPALHLLANPPSPAGRGYIEGGQRSTAGGGTTAWGSTFAGAVMPDVWLRLRRWGDQFAAFRSTNGVDWVLMGQTTFGRSDPCYLGLVASAHSNTSEPTVARFQNYGSVVFTNVTLTITQPPASASAVQNTTAAFSALAEGTGAAASELAYQWQRSDGAGGFTNLSGATGTGYSFTARAGDDGAKFRVRAYYAGLVEDSAAATLTVTPDVTAPTVESVVAAGDPTKITVVFSEEMDSITATSLGAYRLTGPGGTPGISAAAMGANARTVVLTTDAALDEGPTYTLAIQDVRDLAVPANAVAPNPTPVQFQYSSLAGHWQFEEGSGTTTADSSGNGTTGTLLNGPLWVTGQVGRYALEFDGSNDRVDLGNPTALQLTGPMTLAAWVWANGIGDNGRIVTKGGGSGNRGWALNVEGDNVWSLQVASSGTALVALEVPEVPLGAWVHVAGVYDPNDAGGPIMKLYTNGVLGGTLTADVPATQSNSGVNVSIGARADGTTRWNGRIDDVRIYTRALSDPEIAALATPPALPPEFLPPTISGGQIHLDWTGSGRLEWAPGVNGTWTPVAPAPKPPVALDLVPGENRLFRLNATP